MRTINDLRRSLDGLDRGVWLYAARNGYTAEQVNELVREGVAEVGTCPRSGAWLVRGVDGAYFRSPDERNPEPVLQSAV
jgi:hypothetical protein